MAEVTILALTTSSEVEDILDTTTIPTGIVLKGGDPTMSATAMGARLGVVLVGAIVKVVGKCWSLLKLRCGRGWRES